MENRFRGMQQLHSQAVNDLQAVQSQLAEQQASAQTVEQQLVQTQDLAAQMTQDLQTANAARLQAQREAVYWNMVNQEFPELAGIAGALQRMPDLDQQRALFNQVRQTMGTSITAAATRQVTDTLAGVTPGAGPVAGNPAPGEYSRDEIMEHVMDEGLMRSNPTEYATWYQRYQEHPEMGFASLGRGQFSDPFANDFQTMSVAQGQTPAPLTQRHPTQAIEQDNTQPGVWSPNGAWGGTNPPTPPRG
jgi:hypothetical protein